MSIKTLVCGVMVAAATISFSAETFGQRGSLCLNHGFRTLGGGQSAGYHWRTPGPCVGYYNPWSHHNTALRIGIVPQGAGPYLHRLENYGEATPILDAPSGFGQGGDFIGDGSNGNDNHALEANTSDSPQSWPGLSNSRTGGSGLMRFQSPTGIGQSDSGVSANN